MATHKGKDQSPKLTEDTTSVETSGDTQVETPEETSLDADQSQEQNIETEEAIETINAIVEKTTAEIEHNERLELAKELNLSVRTNSTTGELILPSTPAMRAAAARKNAKPIIQDSTMDIEDYVLNKYGEEAVNNPNIQLVISTLADYVKRMSPNASIDEKQGGITQGNLANLYDVVLSLKPEVAQVSLEIIVAVVKQNLRGSFTPRAALRFANTMPVDKERAIRFQLLTTLFMSMASGTTKKDLAKTLNIKQLLEYVTERSAKANISEFIN